MKSCLAILLDLANLFRAHSLLPVESKSKRNCGKNVIAFAGAVLIAYLPALIFEEYTYYLYVVGGSQYFTFSGYRIWFDIVWFVASGAISVVILGRKKWLGVIPPFVASAAFVATIYVEPLCFLRECYISSSDGLGPLRDFLLFASLGFLAANSVVSKQLFSSISKDLTRSALYVLASSILLGYALSFFPMMHLFAGVTSAYPLNYVQWFLAGAPPALVGSLWGLDRGPEKIGSWFGFLCGLSPIFFGLGLAVEVPCSVCNGYTSSVGSLLILGTVFSIAGVILFKLMSAQREILGNLTGAVIAITILLLWGTFLGSSYQMSVVNNIGNVEYNSFSPLEVGHSFVYSGGYLAIPRVTTRSVGITLGFRNLALPDTNGANFLAAGFGDQSPNCCKDGLDLAYRADAVVFSNGTEALLARAWWACDENAACTGYSWQQLLHYGAAQLPVGTLKNLIDLEMNWTQTQSIQWLYRVHFVNGSVGDWVSYSNFIPPSIENHYFDAGLFYVGAGNHPTGYAYFLQFGISSAYPIANKNWTVLIQCPRLVVNGSWECVPRADFISGIHSFWKVLYTFGETYPGLSFTYEGNYTVSFYYSGSSPPDGTSIWTTG